MKHTAPSGTQLGWFCEQVANMKPGQRWRIEWYMLRPLGGFHHNGFHFGPVDRILGNVIGSAYTHSYETEPLTGDIIISCHENTGKRYYTAPD